MTNEDRVNQFLEYYIKNSKNEFGKELALKVWKNSENTVLMLTFFTELCEAVPSILTALNKHMLNRLLDNLVIKSDLDEPEGK